MLAQLPPHWDLLPGGNFTAAPDTTSAAQFGAQLVENSARGAPQAGEKMKLLVEHLILEAGWEDLKDIRKAVTDKDMADAVRLTGVGQGYANQFLKYLGLGDAQPWLPKKPTGQAHTEQAAANCTTNDRPMKYQEIDDQHDTKLTNEAARSIRVPDSAFDDVFGAGVCLAFPYMHVLERTRLTQVVNTYMTYILITLGRTAIGGELLNALAADFKSKFPHLGLWGKSVRTHRRVLINGWRNRRSPPSATSYKGLTVSKADMENSAIAQQVTAAGFGLRVSDTQKSFNRTAMVAVTAVLQVGSRPPCPVATA